MNVVEEFDVANHPQDLYLMYLKVMLGNNAGPSLYVLYATPQLKHVVVILTDRCLGSE